jgi:6-phosphogluconolactonase/glucosamine-6-phosphate isomerase/deaminase
LDPDEFLNKTRKESEHFERKSLNFSFIIRGKQIIFLVLGKNKTKIMDLVLNGEYNPTKYPLQYILKNWGYALY